MSKGLKYYSHYSDSHHHWKFKLLRKKFGWEGEGKFWALNNLIASSEDCSLDLTDENKKEQIAADLEFEKEEFDEFLKYLSGKCRLVKNGDGRYTSDITKEDLQYWEKVRKIDNRRK
jgi:hypothetical protein